jgi:hypothetical protein
LKYAVLCEDDRERTAWDFQDELWHLANDHVERKGADAVAPPDEVHLILTQWREMLDGVRDDPDTVADRIDWVAKLRIVRGFKERHSLAVATRAFTPSTCSTTTCARTLARPARRTANACTDDDSS